MFRAIIIFLCVPVFATGKIFLNHSHKSLSINILFWNNGVGLTSDFKILSKELSLLGHKVNQINIRVDEKMSSVPQADVNIFIEHPFEGLFRYATANYFIPNPEWCVAPESVIKKFDLILCRTHEVERIFNPINPNTYYLSFTSLDRHNKDVAKNFNHFFHLRGQSKTKGTQAILGIWHHKHHLPLLHLVSYKFPDPHLNNLKVFSEYLNEDELTRLENSCGIHLCPSETEGFGHSINEAMSTGAVVVTLNAPPMNEFITDPRCLVTFNRTGRQNLSTTYFVDPNHLEAVVEHLKRLPHDELQRMGNENRERYLSNKRSFLERLEVLFESYK